MAVGFSLTDLWQLICPVQSSGSGGNAGHEHLLLSSLHGNFGFYSNSMALGGNQ